MYGIEYFLDMNNGDTESCMEDIEIRGNILRLSGYGWGQQRHNVDTPALIKGWSYVNAARHFRICNNVFDRSAYRMLHLVAQKQESCPLLRANRYLQYADGMLGQYGANERSEPEIMRFDEKIAETIHSVLGDDEAEIYVL